MKDLIKTILRNLGRLPLARVIWLTITRWFLIYLPIPLGLRDFLMWDLATYVLGEAYEKEAALATGVRMRGEMGDQISRFILFYPAWHDYLWEPQTLRLALKLLTPTSSVFIAGAHIGYHALHLAQKGAGQVFAFEPVQSLFNSLAKNLTTSGLRNLTIEHLALSRMSQTTINLSVGGMRSSIDVALTDEVETVEAASLDDYAQRRGVAKADLIFLDIEGSELNVLQGATHLLRTLPNLVLEVNRPGLKAQGQSPDGLYDFLRTKGYQIFYIEDDYFFTLRGYNPKQIILRAIQAEDEQFHPEMRSFNILAVANTSSFLQDVEINFSKREPIGSGGKV